MAVAITSGVTSPLGNTLPVVTGPLKVTITNVVWDATTYSTGGLAISLAQLQLPNKVVFSIASVSAPATGAVTGGISEVSFNSATGKLQLFNSAGQEVAAATTLTGLGIQIIAYGY
jgi:hypothetical protein